MGSMFMPTKEHPHVERFLNYQADQMTCKVNVGQLLSSVILVLSDVSLLMNGDIIRFLDTTAPSCNSFHLPNMHSFLPNTGIDRYTEN